MPNVAQTLPLLLFAAALTASATGTSRAGTPDPAEFLQSAHAKHADLTAHGLTSFVARVRLRHSDDPGVDGVRDAAAFMYKFTAPDQEEFDFADTLEVLRKPLRDSLTGLWRETTGALCFPYLAGAEGLAAEDAPPLTVLTGTSAKGGAFRASFDTASGRFVDATFADKIKRAWTLESTPGGFQIRSMDVSVADAPVYLSTFDVFRDVRGFRMPTVVRLRAKGKTTEFQVEYRSLNDAAASAEPLSPAAVKSEVDAFEKGWKGWDDGTKGVRVRALSYVESDLASASIAKLALKDSSADVRTTAAGTLGRMRRANVVPALIAALPANEKEIVPYLAVIQALGEIGDPRAVGPLSKDWWNQRVPEYGAAAAKGKIAALGRIRVSASVDALIDTFTMTSADRIAGVRADIVAALTKLTDQQFGPDTKAWTDWWKKAHASFRFRDVGN